MVAVALVAVPLAWLDVVEAIALTIMLLVALIPVACAVRGRRLTVALWVVALHPVMVLVDL